MMNILSSSASRPSTGLRKATRAKGEDNLTWLTRHKPEGDGSVIVLLGGTSPTAFRLRVAQSHLRHDLHPSSWSHVVLLDGWARRPASTRLHEIRLEGPNIADYPPPTNAVQTGRLATYADPARYPNIAVLRVPVPPKELRAALARFRMQRTVLDAVDLVVRWLAFCWGVAGTGNPLLGGYGIPTAAMLDVVMGAAGFDLTPGLESRASCPEAIWQSAKWWHEYYEKQKLPALDGAYVVAHKLMED
ncbi:MAG: hypothetical protein RBU27_11085 [Bacteroidota bacterium]|jgi:hypothetical protein|nr:hypothetical protein [Bacteroidota bacterium]